MRRPVTLIGVIFLVSHAAQIVTGEAARDRRCCRYSSSNSRTDSTSQEQCAQGTESCLLRLSDGDLYSPMLDRCNVQRDSKYDHAHQEEHDKVEANKICLKKDFGSDDDANDGWLGQLEEPPFSLSAYAFANPLTSPVPMPAVEVRIAYDDQWDDAEFRLVDRDVCPEDPEDLDNLQCHPRCVHILKNHETVSSPSKLVYDCEVGFYHQSGQSVPTDGHTYELDICLSGVTNEVNKVDKKCGTFFFVMPSLDASGNVGLNSIPLMDKKAMERDHTVVLHFPPDMYEEQTKQTVQVVLYSKTLDENEDEEWEVLANQNVSVGGRYSSLVFAESDLQLEPGLYRISLEAPDKDSIDVAHFYISDEDGSPLAGLTVLFLLLLALGVLGFFLYRRYKEIQKASVVHPNRLLESGRISGRNVFVITNVDNRHHIDVVMSFNKYLKVRTISFIFF